MQPLVIVLTFMLSLDSSERPPAGITPHAADLGLLQHALSPAAQLLCDTSEDQALPLLMRCQCPSGRE